MQQDSTRRKPLTGAQRRKLRVERGLPPYYAKELETKNARDRERNRAAIAERRALVARIKLTRGCADCGYRTHAEALEFDHLPGTHKVMDVTRLVIYVRTPLQRLLDEMAKCEVVCANCHAVRTAERRMQALNQRGPKVAS